MTSTDYTAQSFTTIIVSAPTPSGVTTVLLNRPTQLNSFNHAVTRDLQLAFNLLSEDERVRCIILTGAGRAFCAGADLSTGTLESDKPVLEHRDEGGQVVLSIHRCKKPVIAAINGPAVGIGITMTLPCTIRLTHKQAKIAFPFVQRGIVPEAVSSWFLPRLIGHSRALHILTTGEVLPGGHRLLDGLFSEVLEGPEEVVRRANEIAEVIATKTSAVSNYLTKAMLWHQKETPEETHLLDSRIMAELYQGADKKEGIQSFMEKRPPKFTGSVEKDLPSNVPWWNEVDTRFRKQSKL